MYNQVYFLSNSNKQSAVTTENDMIFTMEFYTNIFFDFAGMQEYCVDFRMCGAATSHQNWQLYSYPLKMLKSKQKMCKKMFY